MSENPEDQNPRWMRSSTIWTTNRSRPLREWHVPSPISR